MEIRKTLESIVITTIVGWLLYSYFIRDGDTQRQIKVAQAKADSIEKDFVQSLGYISQLQKATLKIIDKVDTLKLQNQKALQGIGDIEQRYQTRKKKQDVIIRATLDSIKTQFKQLQNESSYHFPFYHHPLVQRWLLPVRYGFDDEG